MRFREQIGGVVSNSYDKKEFLCTCCLEKKSADDFYKDRTKNVYRSHCKVCVLEEARKRYKNKRETNLK